MIEADEILAEAAETFLERKKVYGYNYRRVGAAMAALFPDGVFLDTSDDHDRFHILLLIMVKISRYCVNWKGGGHRDSIHDAMVYSAMLEMIDGKIEEQESYKEDAKIRGRQFAEELKAARSVAKDKLESDKEFIERYNREFGQAFGKVDESRIVSEPDRSGDRDWQGECEPRDFHESGHGSSAQGVVAGGPGDTAEALPRTVHIKT